MIRKAWPDDLRPAIVQTCRDCAAGGTAMRAVVAGLLIGLAVLLAPPAFAVERVDVALVLAADVSRSIDDTEFELQRKGYAGAFSAQRVLDAIRAGPHQ